MADPIEIVDPLLAIVVAALEPFDIPTDRAWSDAERVEPAKAVLAALGIEEVGHYSNGPRYEGATLHGGHGMAHTEPIYRLSVFGSSDGEADRG